MKTNSKAARSVLEFREKYRVHEIPRFYSGALHMAFSVVVLFGTCVYSFLQIDALKLWEAAFIPVFFLGGNLVVWLVHKFLLHRDYPFVPYAYEIHTLKHHAFYTFDLYEPESRRDYHILFFPPAVIIGVPLFGLLPVSFGIHQLVSPNLGFLFAFMGAFYFILYEVFHRISHWNTSAPIFKIPFFRNIALHHRLHHDKKLMGKYNFNIVLPIFDHLFGTYYRDERKLDEI